MILSDKRKRFFRFPDRRPTEEAIRILRIHGCMLPDNLHQDEKRINCLNQLVQHLRKSSGTSRRDTAQH